MPHEKRKGFGKTGSLEWCKEDEGHKGIGTFRMNYHLKPSLSTENINNYLIILLIIITTTIIKIIIIFGAN